ncbi:MAG TPA: oligosaccharide flippase family protein [Hyphomonas sp.]|nr:oligosaccharide flippase family protein [Hyphomonas sp.]
MPDTDMPDTTQPLEEQNASDKKLGGAFRSALFWNIANMASSQLISFGLFVFLTYALDPVVFGVFALGVLIVDYFTFQAQSSGIDALIQGQDFTKRGLSSAFWSAFIIFGLAALVIGLSGNFAALVMNEPRLAPVLPALALTLIPLPFAMPPSALLMSRHDFRGIAMRGILCAFLSGIAALAVAFGPAPEWALVVQRAVRVVTAAGFLMLRARWIPQFVGSISLAWSFATRMGKIFFAQAIGASYMRVLDVVVGVAFGAATVGLMRIASRFVDVAQGAFGAPIGSLWVILLSDKENSGQTDKANLLVRLTQMSSLICVPMFAGLMLTSNDLVDFALDKDYKAAGPLLAIMAAAGILTPVAYFRNHALTALGKLNTLMALSMIDVALIIGCAFAARNISPEAVVASLLVVNIVRVVLSAPILVKSTSVRWRDFIAAQLPAYLACGMMAATVIGAGQLLEGQESYLRLAVKSVLGAITYFGYLFLFHRQWIGRAMELLINRKAAVSA